MWGSRDLRREPEPESEPEPEPETERAGRGRSGGEQLLDAEEQPGDFFRRRTAARIILGGRRDACSPRGARAATQLRWCGRRPALDAGVARQIGEAFRSAKWREQPIEEFQNRHTLGCATMRTGRCRREKATSAGDLRCKQVASQPSRFSGPIAPIEEAVPHHRVLPAPRLLPMLAAAAGQVSAAAALLNTIPARDAVCLPLPGSWRLRHRTDTAPMAHTTAPRRPPGSNCATSRREHQTHRAPRSEPYATTRAAGPQRRMPPTKMN